MQRSLIITSEGAGSYHIRDGLYYYLLIMYSNSQIISLFSVFIHKRRIFHWKRRISVHVSERHTLKCIFLLIWLVYRHKVACTILSGLESIEWRRIFSIEGKQPVENVVWIGFLGFLGVFWVKAPPCDQNFAKPLRHFEVLSSTIKISYSTWL